jgi:DUF4097 and DUF4098 domain-containing protein YvlB
MTPTQNRTDLVEHPIGPEGQLELRTLARDVDIRATDGDTVRIRDADGHDLEEQFRIDREPGRLVVRPRQRVSFDFSLSRRGRGRLEVEVPARASVSIDTASGRVRAGGLHGEQTFRTASGAIELDGVSGTLALDAMSGSVTIVAVGRVDVSGRLVSGALRLRGGELGSAAIATTSGSVELLSPLAGPGPYSLQTVSGRARVVAGSGGIRVIASTVTGKVAAESPDGSESRRGNGTLVVGQGRVELAFRSISGSLRVATLEPGSGGATSQASPEPPVRPEPPEPPERQDPASGRGVDTRLSVLRELESGAIDIDTASRRLAALEDDLDA